MYKRSAFIEFLNNDFTLKLPLMAGQFDLLISLFTNHVVSHCLDCLKNGGLLLTDNFQDNIRELTIHPELQLLAIVKYRSNKYNLKTENLNMTHFVSGKGAKKYLVNHSNGNKYKEEQEYFIFKLSRQE